MKPLNRAARGFAIVTAIFILVVLAVLGAFIVNVSTNQQIGSALDVQGVRAYQAARAGIEWGLYQQLRTGSCAPTSSFNPAATTLANFTVTVTCSANISCSVVTAGSFVIGTTYVITTVGATATDFTLIGSANNIIGTRFTATGAGAGTGTATTVCEPIVYKIVSTACSTATCPNTSPGSLYVERRLEVMF